MPRPKRHLLATAEETSNPPAALEPEQAIACVKKGEGKNLYTVELPDGASLLVELPSRFRSAIWIKRGGFVLINTSTFDDRENKLNGEILNVVRDEKLWRKQVYWPGEFAKKSAYPPDSDEEGSIVGKLPPVDDSDTET
ncbi:hypothetical protein MMC26_002673 [Xylographa opegraphella]|nr:hypothetical protein [Xylographa opegraphella]